MSPIKITIVIPIYNVEKYIARCLESVINQTMTEGVECLIINDCTPDNSMDIVQDMIRNCHCNITFRIIHNKQNRGIAYVRNLGIIESRGEYLTYLDGDDYCEHYTLEEMYNLAQKEKAEMVIADYYVHERNNIINYCHQAVPENWEERFKANLSDELKGFLWNKLIRKDFYIRNNINYIQNINFGEDFLIALQIFYYAKKVVHLNKGCVHYMQDNINSYSRSLSRKSLEDIIKCENILYNFLDKHSLTNLVKDEVELIQLRNLNQLIFRSSGNLQRKWTNPYKNMKLSTLIRHKSIIPGLYWKIAISFYIFGSLPLYNIMRNLWRFLRKEQAKRIPIYQ